MVDLINNNEEIRPFLYVFPCTEKNVQVIIYNTNEGKGVFHPGMSTAQILKGVLTYMTVDAHKTLVYKNRYTETYEDAIKLINNEN